MARPVWTGVVSFGLVSLPIALYTATDSHTIHFHQLQRGTLGRCSLRNIYGTALRGCLRPLSCDTRTLTVVIEP